MDSYFKRAFRLTLKDQAIADEALADMPEPYRRLDTAVLEALVLKGPLGLTEDDISHLHGLDYARSFEEARELVESGTFDAGFFLRGIPVDADPGDRRGRASTCRRSRRTSSRRSRPACCSIR